MSHLDSLDMIIQRWKRLEKDFYDIKTDTFDISKIPDIYDCVKYDIMHNKDYLPKDVSTLHDKVKTLADVVIPQEYGITVDEKLVIAQKICKPLLNKIISDFLHIENNSYAEQECFHLLNPSFTTDVESPKRHVRTRLYFTSESHVHSMFNILKYGGLWDNQDPEWEETRIKLESISELNYNTQIIFQIYEDSALHETDPDRFYVVVHFSPGMTSLDVISDAKGLHSMRGKEGSMNSLDKFSTCNSYSNSPENTHFLRHDWGSADNLTDLCYSLDNSPKKNTRRFNLSELSTDNFYPKNNKLTRVKEELSSDQNPSKNVTDEPAEDIMPALGLPFKVGTASLKQVKNLIYQMTDSLQS